VSIENRLKKLETAHSTESGAELDRMIEIELERLGEDAAKEVIDEFLQEYNFNES
jgi:hypothetical protein